MCKFYRIASNSLQAIQNVHEHFDCLSYVFQKEISLSKIDIAVLTQFIKIIAVLPRYRVCIFVDAFHVKCMNTAF